MFALHLRSLNGEPILNPTPIRSEITFAELRGHIEADSPFHEVKLFYGSQEIQDDAVVNIELQAVVMKSPDKAMEQIREQIRKFRRPSSIPTDKFLTAAKFLGSMEELPPGHCDEMMDIICHSTNLGVDANFDDATFVAFWENLGKAFAACSSPHMYAEKVATAFREGRPAVVHGLVIVIVEIAARNGVESFPEKLIKELLDFARHVISCGAFSLTAVVTALRVLGAFGNAEHEADLAVQDDDHPFDRIALVQPELRKALQQLRSRHIIGDLASSESEPLAEVNDSLPDSCENVKRALNVQPSADVADDTDPVVEFKRDLQEARMRSMADGPQPISFDDSVVIYRQTCCSEDTVNALRASPSLVRARARVEEAGCSLFPERANGACLLVPLTDAQLDELGLRLSKVHIVALRSDKVDIEEALRCVPRFHRPKLRDDHRAEEAEDCAQAEEGGAIPSGSSDMIEEISLMHPLTKEIKLLHPRVRELVLQNITAPVPSEASMIVSSPCGDEDSVQPVNPRRYA